MRTFRRRNLITGIGGNLGLPNSIFPFNIPYIFPNGIPAIVFAAIAGILLNLLFLLLPPAHFGVLDRQNINLEEDVSETPAVQIP